MAAPSTRTSQESLPLGSGTLGLSALPIAVPNLLLCYPVGPQSVLVAEQSGGDLPAVPATEFEAARPADD